MKKTILRHLLLFALVSQSVNMYAENNVWHYIKTYQGVSVYWRWREELRDQYISEFKFENNNSYKVDVDFTPVFVCANGEEDVESGGLITIRANDKKYGQWEGLYYYPCNGKQPPGSGGYKNLTVKRVDNGY